MPKSIHFVRRRNLLCTSLSAVLLGFALVPEGCKSKEAAPTPEVAVQVEQAARKPLTEFVSADTILLPRAQAGVVSKISSPVRRFLVQRGSHVHKGQLLAILENTDLIAAVRDSRGALSQADATYVTTTEAAVPEDLRKAQADVVQARNNLEVQQSIFESRENLLKQGAIPRRDLDTARSTLIQAKAANDIAEQHLRSLNSVSQTATLKNAAGALESARGKYAAAQAGLEYSEVRSPIDGVVTDRPLFAGEMANAGQAIVTVMDVSSLIAKVHISPEQARDLHVGAPANVLLGGEGDPVLGKVELISPAVDQGSTTLEIWVAIPNKTNLYKAGVPVHVSITSRTVPDALSVPNESLIDTKAGTTAVMAVGAESVARQKEVKIGITDGRDTEVLSGIQAGDQVITKGAYGLDDGTKVKIAAAGAEEEKSSDRKDDPKPDAGKPAKDGDEK